MAATRRAVEEARLKWEATRTQSNALGDLDAWRAYRDLERLLPSPEGASSGAAPARPA